MKHLATAAAVLVFWGVGGIGLGMAVYCLGQFIGAPVSGVDAVAFGAIFGGIFAAFLWCQR